MTTGHKTNVLVDLDRLLKLRLVVARHGEMDCAGWWNTRGILARHGQIALGRGFPRTHFFAQARIAVAVARSRCRQVFAPPVRSTLWELPVENEDEFDAQWEAWLDDAAAWEPFFADLASYGGEDFLSALRSRELVTAGQAEQAMKLLRSAENRAVAIPGSHKPHDEIIALLAAGFCRGEVGQPAVPYAKLEDQG